MVNYVEVNIRKYFNFNYNLKNRRHNVFNLLREERS